MNKPIIIIKSTSYRSVKMLDLYHKLFAEQLAQDGFILLPNDFEYTVINSDDLECMIEVKEIDWNKPKKVSKVGRFFQKVFSIKKTLKAL